MTMNEKPNLSIFKIWNLCFGFFGIQMGFALQNSNTSRIFQYLGADTSDIAAYWLAAPVTGLIVQPIIGHFSDKTWGKFGRRRIYFLVGAIISAIALLIMPNSPYLWVAIGTLWIMDASFNITMEPFRALVGDQLPRSQRALGYAMQSLFIGAGSVIASALPWILAKYFTLSEAEGAIPQVVIISFYVGAAILLVTVLWTVFTTKEYSPEELEAMEKADMKHENITVSKNIKHNEISFSFAIASIIIGIVFAFLISIFSLEKELFVLSGMAITFGLALLYSWNRQKNNKKTGLLYEVMNDLMNMPKIMRRLTFVQFFSWTSLFIMWIYTTPAVAFNHYGALNAQDPLYTKAGNWVGILFGVYNLSAFFIAILIPVFVKLIGLRKTHQLNLCLGAIGFISIIFIKDPLHLIFSMILVGAAWSSILSLPYAMLSGAIPFKKMGVYMGIFNFFIVIPQIVTGSVIGSLLVTVLGNSALLTFYLAGGSLIIAAIFTQFAKREF